MEHLHNQSTAESIIFAALSTLTQTQLSFLTLTLSTTFRRHSRRLATLLSSPILFSTTLNYLYSLSLPNKTLLIAKHLLSTLHILVPFLQHPLLGTGGVRGVALVPLRELDAALLLLLFCELRQHDPKLLDGAEPEEWQRTLTAYFSKTTLTLSGIEASHEEVLGDFVDIVVTSMRFAGAGGKAAGREVAASVEAVVGLPAVEVGPGGGGAECVVCREEMREGREVCGLPCGHMFHWWCVLPWFRKRNTCPCCRFRLPTDDVYGEIERLWEVLVRVGRPVLDGELCT